MSNGVEGTVPKPVVSGRLRVVSGMRPTGRLHVGHYHGALRNWLALSDQHSCFFFSADWHALTTHYRDPGEIKRSERDMIADWLAVGLDPDKVVLFSQSDVPQHAELSLLLGMLTPVGWLERVPTYKEQQVQLSDRDLSSVGFLGYPVLQTADVAVYRGEAVPVGQDQVAHLEVSREIVRRFNHLYAPDSPNGVIPEPRPLLTPVPKILGTDGRKMSKSYGNAIELGEPEESARKKIMASITDPQRARRQDPGTPEVCPIYHLHVAQSPAETVEEITVGCRSAGIGCVDCKKKLLVNLVPLLVRHREARTRVESDPGRIDEILDAGAARARAEAEQTLDAVRTAMQIRRK